MNLCARLCMTATALCDSDHLLILKAEAEVHEHETDKFIASLVEERIDKEISDYWNKVYDGLDQYDSE